MNHYISPDEAAWFGYLDDVTSFYANGPAFTGANITYAMAEILLDDMSPSSRRSATAPASWQRSCASRTLRRSSRWPRCCSCPAAPGNSRTGCWFTYASDPLRGAEIAPMGANIQWDLYRDGNTNLVRMLYNKRRTSFKPSCTPIRSQLLLRPRRTGAPLRLDTGLTFMTTGSRRSVRMRSSGEEDGRQAPDRDHGRRCRDCHDDARSGS
jgi:hypothetical protein